MENIKKTTFEVPMSEEVNKALEERDKETQDLCGMNFGPVGTKGIFESVTSVQKHMQLSYESAKVMFDQYKEIEQKYKDVCAPFDQTH